MAENQESNIDVIENLALIKAPKTVPIPTPAPLITDTLMPAPINLAA